MTTQNEALKGKNFPVLSTVSERLPDYEVNFRCYPGFAFPCLLLILKFFSSHFPPEGENAEFCLGHMCFLAGIFLLLRRP